ncbi:MAG: acetate--CoA ligase, partial [Crocinitomicaceae bacterium]
MNFKIKSREDYNEHYELSIKNPENFWEKIAENFTWKKKWNKVLDYNFQTPEINWFKDAKLNITENIFDRHLKDKGNDIALIWEPNNPNDKSKTYTYQELYNEVNIFANTLKSIGVKKDDTVCIYLPMIPQLSIAMLACARIGAIHSVIFAGFSAKSIADRVNDLSAKVVITADGLNRGEKHTPIKPIVDEALEHCPTVKDVIVFNHTDFKIEFVKDRDHWWNELSQGKSNLCEAEEMDAEDPLFVLYTSGSTGKPKGVVHTCGGYMVQVAYTFQNVFQYEENDVYWCTADIGWITGHSYIVYGPLLCGATTLIFEGVPSYPDASRFWQVCDKHKVAIFYTAPTAIRSLMSHGDEFVKKANLCSLKVIGSVGEPINEEAWQWYNKLIGKEKCPVVDTWWQTETGGIMLSALAGITPSKSTYAGLPLPGILPVLLTKDGEIINDPNVEGLLCFNTPWPGMIRSIFNDHGRFKQAYFSSFPGYYFSGDGAKKDKDGLFRIIGRMDDVINVSGHRFGTAEIENAINTSSFVIE